MKKQVVVIHGGDTFDNYEDHLSFLKEFEIDKDYFEGLKKKGWKATLGEKLGEDYEVILPQMPSKGNAKYAEWKIWFDKLVPFFEDNLILIGHSMGGIFLAKYLAENILPKSIHGLFMVAAPYDAEGKEFSLADFTLPADFKKLEEQAGKIFIYHSEDDKVVLFADAKKYADSIKTAQLKTFSDRGHFNQEELPELVQEIENLN